MGPFGFARVVLAQRKRRAARCLPGREQRASGLLLVRAETWRFKVTKMTATIEVEFELAQGQPESVAVGALARGVGMLATSIEGVTGGGPSGVKKGTVRTKITDQEITT